MPSGVSPRDKIQSVYDARKIRYYKEKIKVGKNPGINLSDEEIAKNRAGGKKMDTIRKATKIETNRVASTRSNQLKPLNPDAKLGNNFGVRKSSNVETASLTPPTPSGNKLKSVYDNITPQKMNSALKKNYSPGFMNPTEFK